MIVLSASSWTLAAVAVALLGYAAVSRRLSGTWLTAAMVFTAVGLAAGDNGLGLVDAEVDGENVKLLVEATLTLVLFADASRIDLRALRREYALPSRLLGIGLPLTLVAGLAAGMLTLTGLSWSEALLLAVILAPTDAALGQAVVTEPSLPLRIRQSLNVESGLNDGICVPIFYTVLAIADTESGDTRAGSALRLLAEQLGYGVAGGLVAGAAAALMLGWAVRHGSIDGPWLQVVPVAGAALAYGLAAPIGGSGFIAAFTAGATFGSLRRDRGGEVERLIEELGGVLTAITFIVFGAVMLGPALEHLSAAVVAYAVVSLTVVRMLPVAVAMVGTGARRQTVLFVGWFGPRGLASIVFGLLVIEQGQLAQAGIILQATAITVGLSVLAHGATAAPLARRYGAWFTAHPSDRRPPLEDGPGPPVRWRLRRHGAAV
jgi:NhaP-type Na+/H+ or K+/H+ antiporter